MIELYDIIFNEYKKFMIERLPFEANIVKFNNNASPYFPTIVFIQNDNMATDYCTLGQEEKYEQYFFTIDIYAKDKMINNSKIPANNIASQIAILTSQFFEKKYNMRKTFNAPTVNFDTEVYRRTMQFECMVGNARGNIINY